jgi:hypothetical protein
MDRPLSPGYLDAAGVAVELGISEAEAKRLFDRKEIPSIARRDGTRVTPRPAVDSFRRRQRGETVPVVTLSPLSSEELVARFIERHGRTPREVVRDFRENGFEDTAANTSLWFEALALADLETQASAS